MTLLLVLTLGCLAGLTVEAIRHRRRLERIPDGSEPSGPCIPMMMLSYGRSGAGTDYSGAHGADGGTEPVELEPLEFIARLVQHIPDVRERQVVYYGVCASAYKRLPRRRPREGRGASAGTLIPLEEPTP
jgi:hypothetical protein